MSEARELARVAVIEGQQHGLERTSVWLCWGPHDLGKTSFLREALFLHCKGFVSESRDSTH